MYACKYRCIVRIGMYGDVSALYDDACVCISGACVRMCDGWNHEKYKAVRTVISLHSHANACVCGVQDAHVHLMRKCVMCICGK